MQKKSIINNASCGKYVTETHKASHKYPVTVISNVTVLNLNNLQTL